MTRAHLTYLVLFLSLALHAQEETKLHPVQLDDAGATSGQVLKYDGAKWTPQDEVTENQDLQSVLDEGNATNSPIKFANSYFPQGGHIYELANEMFNGTGMVVITFPAGLTTPAINMRVSLASYYISGGENRTILYSIYGKMSSPEGWSNSRLAAAAYGSSGEKFPRVRFAKDSLDRQVVMIGDTTSVFRYSSVTISTLENFMTTQSIDSVTITLEDSEAGFTNIYARNLNQNMDVDLLDGKHGDYYIQELVWNGSTGELSIDNANSVDLDGRYVINETDPSVPNTASTGQVLKWDGSEWAADTDENTTYTGTTSIQLVGNSITRAALTGDVSASQNSNNVTVTGLRGRNISTTAPTSGQILKWNGSDWSPADDDTGGGGGGNTDISVSVSGTTATINSSTGTGDSFNFADNDNSSSNELDSFVINGVKYGNDDSLSTFLYNDEYGKTIFDHIAQPYYTTDNPNEIVKTGHRLEVTDVNTTLRRMRLNRDVSTMRLERGTKGRPWHFISRSTGSSGQLGSVHGEIIDVDYENNYLYYDAYYPGGTSHPTVGHYVELVNPFTNYEITHNEQAVFPEIEKGQAFQGRTVDYNIPATMQRLDDNSYVAVVDVRFTNGDSEGYLATSPDGINWTLTDTVLYDNSVYPGISMNEIVKIPNDQGDLAGKYLCIMRLDPVDFGGYMIMDEDFNQVVGLTEFPLNEGNEFNITRATLRAAVFHEGKIRFAMLDLESNKGDRKIKEYIYEGKLQSILDGLADESEFTVQTIKPMNTSTNADMTNGVHDIYGYLTDGDKLVLTTGYETWAGLVHHQKRLIVGMILSEDGTWRFPQSPYIVTSPLLYRLLDQHRGTQEYVDYEDRMGMGEIYKVGDDYYCFTTMSSVSTNDYQSFLLKITRNGSGEIYNDFSTGEISVDSGGTTVRFDRPFELAPTVVVTALGSSYAVPVIDNIDPYKFDIKVYDASGTAISGTINYIAKNK